MPYKQKQNPHYFLDTMLVILNCKNDAALCRKLGMAAPIISKVRHGVLRVSPGLLLRLHDTSGRSIAELRELLYHVDEQKGAEQ